LLLITDCFLRAASYSLLTQHSLSTHPTLSGIMPTETHLKILKHIESNPHISQRQLAQELGVSVGKINYCVKALTTLGWVKAGNFKRSSNKMSYLYLLTPAGIDEKTRLTASFLKRKIAEHEKITQEIEQLKRDAQ
jgi:EPS-associated MarR family transcriptional regulator